MKKLLLFFGLIAFCCSCTNEKKESLILDESNFETTYRDKAVHLYTLKNENGMVAQITNYGARIVSLIVPDKSGKPTDVVWGYKNIKDYLSAGDIYSGPIVGRFGNRIAKGKFSIGDDDYQLTINNEPNHLHGGFDGLYDQVWEAKPFVNEQGEKALKLICVSPDGEDGYPGNFKISVVYTIKKDNSIAIDYVAKTDKPTPCNPTNHSYFNLHGTSSKTIDSHILWVKADNYTPTDSVLIPTGEIATVENTPADFREPTAIGKHINDDHELIRFGSGGYDMNFVLNKKRKGIEIVASLYEPENGILMEIFTDQPGLQFYSGQGMNGKDIGKRDDVHHKYSGLALETQGFPDAPNHSNFPNAILNVGENYEQSSIYRFRVK